MHMIPYLCNMINIYKASENSDHAGCRTSCLGLRRMFQCALNVTCQQLKLYIHCDRHFLEEHKGNRTLIDPLSGKETLGQSGET